MTDDNQADQAVAAEPTAELPGEAKSAKTGSSLFRGVAGGLIGGVLVLLLAAGGLVAAWPILQTVLIGDLQSRLATAERAVEDANGRIAAIQREQAQVASSDAATSLPALAQRVAALEAQVRTSSSSDPRLTALADQLGTDTARLKGEIDAVRQAIPPEGTILKLVDRAESAEKEARQIASQHASAQALLLVVGQLSEAVNRGDPYQSELRAARRVAGPEDASLLDALTADAANGIPRKDALVVAFPALANDIVRAGYGPATGDLWQRVRDKMTALVTIRRTDGKGDDTASIVARAEAGAKQGDVVKAAAELAGLKDEPAQVAAPWIHAANARGSADRVLSELAASAAAQTAKSGE
jgi:hypothetical protein